MILSNVNIGTAPSAGDGDPLRSAFSTINNNFQIVTNNVNALITGVTSVAGRTGNVILTTHDIVGISYYATNVAITTANVGMRGYVDSKIAANIAALVDSAPILLDTLNELAAALNDDASFSTTITNMIASTNANVTLANTNMKGYVDGQITSVNSAVTLANTIQSAQISAANVGMLGYVNSVNTTLTSNAATQSDLIIGINANVTLANTNMKGYVDGQVSAANSASTLANTIVTAGIVSANLGMKGYVDSVANQSIYGNSNVKSYLTGGFDGSIMPSANVTYDLGSHSYRWRDLWLSGSTIYIGNANISVTNNSIQSSLPISSDVTGNITSSNITITGNSMSLGGATLSVTGGALHSSLPIAASITATNLTIQGTRINYGQGAYIEESEVAGMPGTYGLALNSADDGIVGMNALDSNALVTSSMLVSNVSAQINVANPNPAGNVLVWMFEQSGTLVLPTDGTVRGENTDVTIEVSDTASSGYTVIQKVSDANLAQLSSTALSFNNYVINFSGSEWRFSPSGNLTFINGTIQTTAFNNTAPIITTLTANAAAQSDLIIGINANVTLANTIQNAQILAANIGMLGYVNSINTTLTANAAAQSDLIIGINANVTQANIGMLGYVNSVASQSIYSNVNVQAYTETMSFTNFSNVNVAAYLSTQGITSYSNVQVATYLPTYTGNIGATVNGYSIGYRDVPQVSAGNVTLSATDSGKHYYSTATAPVTLTVPSNANVAFATGTAITIINAGAGNITIAKQVEASLYMAGNATSASRTLTSYGMATLLKTASDQWFINGTGLN